MPEHVPGLSVLLVSQRPSDFVEMKRCAEALREMNFQSTMLYFVYANPADDELPVIEDMRALKANGVFADARLFTVEHKTIVSVDEFRQHVEQKPTPWAPATLSRPNLLVWYQKLVPLFIRTFIRKGIKPPIRALYGRMRRLGRLGRIPMHYVRTLQGIRHGIRELRPDVIVLPEDVVGAVTPLVIHAGHELRVPSVILPYTIANQEEAFQSLKDQASYQLDNWPNRIVALLFPKWAMRRDGVNLVRLPAPHILGQELTRTSPPDPWMMNSGFADVIAVENAAMDEYYRAAGIPPNKMRVVGAIYDDTLADLAKNKSQNDIHLRQQLGITSNRPLLVIGGCPDQSKTCPRFDFASMQDFCNAFAGIIAMRSTDYEVIVRPHPNFPKMGDYLSEHGIRVSSIDTARLVALSDAYIAFGSATIRWAIACGIPTINYDVFGYDYKDFKSVAGVTHVKDDIAFAAAIAQLNFESKGYLDWKKRAQADAAKWGTLDGHSAQRIARLIHEIRSSHPAKQGL